MFLMKEIFLKNQTLFVIMMGGMYGNKDYAKNKDFSHLYFVSEHFFCR
jgi:hypothetical protein